MCGAWAPHAFGAHRSPVSSSRGLIELLVSNFFTINLPIESPLTQRVAYLPSLNIVEILVHV